MACSLCFLRSRRCCFDGRPARSLPERAARLPAIGCSRRPWCRLTSAMTDTGRTLLLVGAVLDALAAALHVGCIVFGAPWYRFFGAGERMAQMASAGSWYPTLVTSAIASILGVWSLYALSGAGALPRLPYVRFVLGAVTAIYLLR